MISHGLTNQNYYDDTDFISVSMVKAWLDCSSRELSLINKEQDIKEFNINFAIGHMFESLIQGDFDSRYENTAEYNAMLLTSKNQPNADNKKVIEMYNRVKEDEIFMKACSGEYEKILVGEIHGVKFRCKVDVINEDKKTFTDIKTTKSLGLSWDDNFRKKVPFYETWNYWLQLAVYQEIIRQNYGELFWPLIAVSEKTKPFNYDVLKVEKYKDGTFDRRLMVELSNLKYHIKLINDIKKGEVEPIRCERCKHCIDSYKIKKTSTMESYL